MEKNTNFYLRFSSLRHFLCARAFFKAHDLQYGPVECMPGGVWFVGSGETPNLLAAWLWEKMQAVVAVFDSNGDEVLTENIYRL